MARRGRYRRRYKPYSRRPYMGFKKRGGRTMAPRRTGGYFGARTRMIRAEKKVVDVASDITAINSTVLAPILLNSTAAGSDFTERIGRKIQMKSIQGRINFRLDPQGNTDINHASVGRFVVYYDKQWNGGTLTPINATELLQNATPNTDFPTLSPINLNNRDRYKVLLDKVLTIDMGKQSAVLKYYKKINLETVYNSNLSGSGAIQTGALLFWYVGSHVAGADDAEISYYHRMRFIDL